MHRAYLTVILSSYAFIVLGTHMYHTYVCSAEAVQLELIQGSPTFSTR